MPSWYERGPLSELFESGWKEGEERSRENRGEVRKVAEEGRALEGYMKRSRTDTDALKQRRLNEDEIREAGEQRDAVGRIQAINDLMRGDQQVAQDMGRFRTFHEPEGTRYEVEDYGVPHGKGGAKFLGDYLMKKLETESKERIARRPGGPNELVDRSSEVPALREALMRAEEAAEAGDPEAVSYVPELKRRIARSSTPMTRQESVAMEYGGSNLVGKVMGIHARRQEVGRRIDSAVSIATEANRIKVVLANIASMDRQDANRTTQLVGQLASADKILADLAAEKRAVISANGGVLPSTDTGIGREMVRKLQFIDEQYNALQQQTNQIRAQMTGPGNEPGRGGVQMPGRPTRPMPRVQDPEGVR